MMTTDKPRKKYWLQLRDEGRRARMVEYVGTETREDGEKVILLEAWTRQGQRLYALEKSTFLIAWRAWNRPPQLEWIRKPWKNQ
ncbi:MAG: hypothetical protein IKH30_01610 [Clostridia bacterium]|nr:hypothetical protein [Clostridia bacterium]MBR4537229.1 hypothetical protein [Clostridia bacterium]